MIISGIICKKKTGGGGIIADAWHGYPLFQDKEGRELTLRRRPAFFETFPVTLVDKDEIVRGDISFRSAESKYIIEQIVVSCNVDGGKFKVQVVIDAPIVNSMQEKPNQGNFWIC